MVDSDEVLEFVVSEEESGRRLDQLLVDRLSERERSPEANHQQPSRSQLATWIQGGLVHINGESAGKAGLKLRTGDRIRVEFPPLRELSIIADASVPFRVVFEDESVLVIDKPAGVVVHPGAGTHEGTLVHGLLHHFADEDLPQIGDAHRPGLVHRLDKDTTGLMVVAKTELAFHHLVNQLKPPRTMRRVYLALSQGLPRRGVGSEVNADGLSGRILLPIGRHLNDRVRMAVREEGGREAETLWKLCESFEQAQLCEITLGTGRTHQIRVHFAACRAPLLGDRIYSGPASPLPAELRAALKRLGRQALHAAELSFIHPVSGNRVTFVAPLPDDFQQLLDKLRGAECGVE